MIHLASPLAWFRSFTELRTADMLMLEPPRTRFDLHFPVFGVPVRIHPLFFLTPIVLASRDERIDFNGVILWTFALTVSILWHELGHAWMFRRFHHEPRIVLYWLGGLAIPEASWTPRELTSRQQILISLAGPGAGFVLAAAVVALLFAVGRSSELFGYTVGRGTPLHNPNLAQLVHDLLWVNVGWGLVNLAPVFPLDGGQVARELFQMQRGEEGIIPSLTLSLTFGIVAAVGFLFWLGWKEGLFPALLFGSMAYLNYQELKFRRSEDVGGRGWRDDREW